MDAGTIEKIESMVLQNQTVEIDGQAFSQKKLEPIKRIAEYIGEKCPDLKIIA